MREENQPAARMHVLSSLKVRWNSAQRTTKPHDELPLINKNAHNIQTRPWFAVGDTGRKTGFG
jgi:hypothetical protein